jgi:hypothetical protein
VHHQLSWLFALKKQCKIQSAASRPVGAGNSALGGYRKQWGFDDTLVERASAWSQPEQRRVSALFHCHEARRRPSVEASAI